MVPLFPPAGFLVALSEVSNDDDHTYDHGVAQRRQATVIG